MTKQDRVQLTGLIVQYGEAMAMDDLTTARKVSEEIQAKLIELTDEPESGK